MMTALYGLHQGMNTHGKQLSDKVEGEEYTEEGRCCGGLLGAACPALQGHSGWVQALRG